MKPYPNLLCVLALVGLGEAPAITTVWNPATNGVTPPATGDWHNAANWTNGLPGVGDKAVFNVTGAAECVLSGPVTVQHLVTGDNGPGGVVRLASGANLTTTSWSGPFNHSSTLIVEPGATAHFQTKLLVGQFDNPGSYDVEFRMNGGTVIVGDVVRIGESFDDSNVAPHIQLDGGTLTADALEIDRGTTDITGGTVLLREDHSSEIQGFIDAGRLTAYNGAGTIVSDWNGTNANLLTITARAPATPGSTHDAQPTVSGPGSEGYHTTGTVDGREVWIADNMLYFNLPSGEFPVGEPVHVRVEYLDVARGYLKLKYDSDYGDAISDKFRQSEVHTRSSRVDGGGFVSSYHLFENPRFANRQNGGNDFRIELADNNGEPFQVASVTLSTTPFQDPDFQYALSRPWLQPYAGPTRDFTDPKTLAGKVMTGYQGWFATPNDLDDGGWRHWGRSAGTDPSPTEITVDMWPWLEEYEADRIYPAGQMVHQDGRPAYVFSSRDPETVQRHFRWMRRHNIDGAYLQRFVSRSSSGSYGASEFVLDNVRKAANQEGRVWAIEYDVSSLTNEPNPFEVITNDWNWLVNEVGILDDPRYVHENGKPVLFIWGFSVPGREGLTLAEADAILDWFNTQNLYLIGGLHSSWESNTSWFNHYRKYDQILAWMERDLGDLTSQKNRLDSWGMKILPHAWPGFSWHNLKKLVPNTQFTARSGGDFYWTRLYNAVSVGADQIFLGMFDEYDEGTAIMPMSDMHPDPHTTWGKYLDNEGLDPFWYLQLSGEARDMLNGFRPLSASTPAPASLPPVALSGDDATIHLGAGNTVLGLEHPQPADGITTPAVINGHGCRTSTGPYLYFAIDDAHVFSNSAGQEATIEVEFHDSAPGTSLALQFDGLGGAYSPHPGAVNPPDGSGWRTVRWNVSDGFFGNRQNNGSDFRIALTGSSPLSVRRVSVFLPEDEGGGLATGNHPGFELVNDGLEWPAEFDATGWRLFTSPALHGPSWQEASPVTISGGKVRYEPDFSNPSEFYRLQRPSIR